MREELKRFDWNIHGLSEQDIGHIYGMIKKTIEERRHVYEEYSERIKKEKPKEAMDILDDIGYYTGLEILMLWQFG